MSDEHRNLLERLEKARYRKIEKMIDEGVERRIGRVIEGGKVSGDNISGGGGSTPIPGGALPPAGDDVPYAPVDHDHDDRYYPRDDADSTFAATEHASQHAQGGSDALEVDSLPASETDTTVYLRPDGSGGVEWATPPGGGNGGGTPDPHAASHELGGSDAVSLDASQIGSGQLADGRISESSVTQHAPSQSQFDSHASRHEQGGADAIETESLGTAETNTSRVLRPDGSGGVQWGEGGIGGASALDDLSDVDTTGKNDGDVLTWDSGASAWQAAEPTGGDGGGNGSYAETIGDGTEMSFAITHELGTTDVIVQLWDLTGTDPLLATGDADSIEATGDDTVTVTFSVAPGTDDYRAVVLASGGGSNGDGGNSAIIVRSAPPVYDRSSSGSGSVTKGQFFTPTLDIDVYGLGFIGEWNASHTYRLRIVELDGSRAVVATPYDELFSPSLPGYSELTTFALPAVTLNAETEYAAICTALGQPNNFALPLTWPTSDTIPWGPWISDTGFRISNSDPTSLSSPTATGNPSAQFVLYWALT